MDDFNLQSPAFVHEQQIPAKYTCQGKDVNPPLLIKGVPPDTKSLVLIMDDPDAPMGTWDHWVIWNISSTEEISENSVPSDAVQGKNSWGRNEYGGPCPPSGTHRYFFKLYALDTQLDISPNSTKKDVETEIEGHILGKTVLMGTYSKS
ncbi:MAG: putative lipoprotein LppC [Chlamydiae bacterium]|nr:putative lipoprotein LppC [Chlamydiota bacterium]